MQRSLREKSRSDFLLLKLYKIKHMDTSTSLTVYVFQSSSLLHIDKSSVELLMFKIDLNCLNP